jgi:hypothetical protein
MSQDKIIAAYLQNQLSQDEKNAFILDIKNNPELADQVRVAKARWLMSALADIELEQVPQVAKPENGTKMAWFSRLSRYHWLAGLCLLLLVGLFVIDQSNSSSDSRLEVKNKSNSIRFREELNRETWYNGNEPIEKVWYQYKTADNEGNTLQSDTLIEYFDVKGQRIEDAALIRELTPIKFPRQSNGSIKDMVQTPFEKTKPAFQIDQDGLSSGNYGAGGDLELAKLAWMQDSMQRVLLLTEDVPASSAKYLRALAMLELGRPKEAYLLLQSILDSKYERYSEDWWNKDDVEWFCVLARFQAGETVKTELLKISSQKIHKYQTEADKLYKKIQ